MFIERKQDLSIYYWLEDIFQAYPTVQINDGFPEEGLERPSVTIESEDIKPLREEMGVRTTLRQRMWVIDVIATNKAQRDELTSIILNQLEYGMPVYDYDEGFPPAVSPTQLGLLRPIDWEVRTIRVFPDLTEKLYWRNSLRFYTEYNAI